MNLYYLKKNKGRFKLYPIPNGILVTYLYKKFVIFVERKGEKPLAIELPKSLKDILGFELIFSSQMSKYFSDYPELAEKIKNKELNIEHLSEIVRIYNDWYILNHYTKSK